MQNYVTLPKICEQVDFYHYRVVVCTHCQDTFQFKQHVKVNFASDDPFKKDISLMHADKKF